MWCNFSLIISFPLESKYLDKCPKCGSENIDYATRVIGYLVRVSKWSADRQEEHSRRYYG